MPAPTWAVDLQDVRALAHELYCACTLLIRYLNAQDAIADTSTGQEQSSIYRPLARSIRTLRNRLEEADDALDELSVRAEAIDVLQAAGESKTVLVRLEQAIHRQRNPSVRIGIAVNDSATDLLNDIDEVTRKLCTALEALEHVNGTLGRLMKDASLSDISSTQTPLSPASMTSNSEDGNLMSTASSSWSFSSKRASLSQRLSVNSERSRGHDYKPEEEKQVVSPLIMSSHPNPVDDGRSQSTQDTNRWSTQFAYFDPMSVDIDSASSLIMGRRPSPNPPALMPRSPARIGSPPALNTREQLTATATSHPPSAMRSVSDSYVNRSASLRADSVPPRAELGGRLHSSASLRSSPRNATFAPSNRRSRDEIEYHIAASQRNLVPELVVPKAGLARISARPPVDPISEESKSPEIPARRSSTRIRDKILSRATQVPKSRYRIVNAGKDEIGGADSTPASSNPTPLSSPISPVDSGRRISSSFTPSLYRIESLPTPQEAHNDHDSDFTAESELDQEIVNAIVSSWNSGLWDQAKHNIEILSSRHCEPRDDDVARRLQYLLGIIASINGELEQALAHFIAVFSEPIEDVHQLDAGHCAAAYWMGDIYALMGCRTEVLLAYSVAAKSPLFDTGEWQPLKQQILADREACRIGGVKTGVNIFSDKELQEDDKAADTILDPRIIARDVARTLMQADSQPVNSDTSKSDPSRSRAMQLHDMSTQAGSWQEKHKLEIDVMALNTSGPWPLPFDPFFVFDNVRRHRLSAPGIDLLRSGLSAAKIPKKSRPYFSCQDLRWLILNLRASLERSHIDWTEAVIDNGPRFIARYKVAGAGIASCHFFTIAVYRLSFRPGYGADICSDGIFNSRIQSNDPKSEKGVHSDELKRVKKMIKEHLESAAKKQEATESRSMALPVMSINGVTSLHLS